MNKATFKFYNLFLITLIFSFSGDTERAVSERSWKLKLIKEEVSIYTRNVDYSRVKELKMVTRVKSDIQTISDVLDDINTYKKWMHGFRRGKDVKILSPTKKITYSVINFPDPLDDRNLLSQTTVIRDTINGTVTFTANALTDESYRNEDMVMITEFSSTWVLKPLADGTVEIESYLFCDPAGNLPNFLINRMLYRSPLKTILKLRKLVEGDDLETQSSLN